MTIKELILKVKAMRDAQKDGTDSKALEKEVDEIVDRGVAYYAKKQEQQKAKELIKQELQLENIKTTE